MKKLAGFALLSFSLASALVLFSGSAIAQVFPPATANAGQSVDVINDRPGVRFRTFDNFAGQGKVYNGEEDLGQGGNRTEIGSGDGNFWQVGDNANY